MAEQTQNQMKMFLFTALAATVVSAVYVHHDANKLERDLQPQASTLIQELVASYEKSVDATATVTATRKYILFGEPKGKITVYIRDNAVEEGSATKGGLRNMKYSGVEFMFSRLKRDWKNTESGECAVEPCQINAQLAFDAAGI